METREIERLDVAEYVGDISVIETAEFKDAKHGRILFVETAVIPLREGDTLPKDSELRASNMLSIMQDDESQEFFIGKDSKAEKFLLSHGIDIEKNVPDAVIGAKVKKLIGKKVKVQKKDSGFLEIA